MLNWNSFYTKIIGTLMCQYVIFHTVLSRCNFTSVGNASRLNWLCIRLFSLYYIIPKFPNIFYITKPFLLVQIAFHNRFETLLWGACCDQLDSKDFNTYILSMYSYQRLNARTNVINLLSWVSWLCVVQHGCNISIYNK